MLFSFRSPALHDRAREGYIGNASQSYRANGLSHHVQPIEVQVPEGIGTITRE